MEPRIVIHVALRFDDPSVESDIALEQAIFSSLARHRARATVAVIPFKMRNGSFIGFDAKRVLHIAQAEADGTIEIALHGYSHQKQSGVTPTEFCGASAAQQAEWIASGLASLQPLLKKPIAGFVPPFNSYDAGTLHAVHANHLRYLSAGFDGPTDGPLALVPRTCQMLELRVAIEEARSLRTRQSVIIGVMHHYDFVESGAQNSQMTLQQFDFLMRWLSEQPDIRWHVLSTLAEAPMYAFVQRVCQRRALLNRLPYRLRSALPRHALTDLSLTRLIKDGLLGR